MNFTVKIVIILVIWALALITNAQTYNSLVSYFPTYETDEQAFNVTIKIQEDRNLITFYNATYEGEITNLRIDSIKTMYWTFEQGEVKTFFCTNVDDTHPKIRVLDLMKTKNVIKLIYLWDEISIEEYSFIANTK